MQKRQIMVGMDEAGYGPLLGPYVLGISYFGYTGSEGVRKASPDFWDSLADAVSRTVKPNRIAVNDSKIIFKRKKGLSSLEDGVLSFLSLSRKTPSSFRSLLDDLGEDSAKLDRYPWYEGRESAIPRSTFSPFVKVLAGRLSSAFGDSLYEFLGLRVKILHVGDFNELVERFDNKSKIGLFCIGENLKLLWNKSRDADVNVFVDRQGGRTRYARFLWNTLQPKKIIGICETSEISSYRVEGVADARITVNFIKKGDKEALPIALASMTAKYIRELHMELFNRYFVEKLQGDLRPTAGYVQDGRRFLADIEPYVAEKKLDPELLVRKR